LHLVQRVRDEAHRFAVTFHRKRRDSERLSSVLLDIPGVGEKTARKLLRSFGSLRKVKAGSLEELSSVVSRPQAERIQSFFASGDSA
jgi:excinuclease ABC subunit C